MYFHKLDDVALNLSTFNFLLLQKQTNKIGGLINKSSDKFDSGTVQYIKKASSLITVMIIIWTVFLL